MNRSMASIKQGMLKTIKLGAVIFGFLLILSAGNVPASSEGGHGEESAPKGWVATDTYRVLNFAALAVALFLILRKPFSQALGDRIKGIKEQLSDLEEKKKAAELELAQFNQKLANLEKEANAIIDQYKKQGEEARAKILKEAESAAEKLQEQARRNMEYELKGASLKLQAEIFEKAMAKAESIIKNKISSQDQDRLIDDYLKKVEAQ